MKNLPMNEQLRKFFYYYSDQILESTRGSGAIASAGASAGGSGPQEEEEQEIIRATGIYVKVNDSEESVQLFASTSSAVEYITNNISSNDTYEVEYWNKTTTDKISVDANVVLSNATVKFTNKTPSTKVNITTDGEAAVYLSIPEINYELTGFEIVTSNISSSAISAIDHNLKRVDGEITSTINQWHPSGSLTIDDCIIDGGTTTRSMVRSTNVDQVQDVNITLTVKNSTVAGGTTYCIRPTYTSKVYIENCNLSCNANTNASVIHVARTKDIDVIGCTLDGDSGDTKYAIYLDVPCVMIEDALIQNNTFTGFNNRTIFMQPLASGNTTTADPNVSGGIRNILNTAIININNNDFDSASTSTYGYIHLQFVKNNYIDNNTFECYSGGNYFHVHLDSRDANDVIKSHTYNTYNIPAGSLASQTALRAEDFAGVIELSDYNTYNLTSGSLFRYIWDSNGVYDTPAEVTGAGYGANSTFNTI